MTGPLARHLAALIQDEGPIGVDRYMALALGHPTLGYYTTRDPLGVAGDFTTAPEISQMFGELVGLWAAAVYEALGAPPAIGLVELGPGRGTLMADALRAVRAAPAFHQALAVHLVETSPVLRECQRGSLAGSGHAPRWHDSMATLPDDAPLIVVANEFLDALPVRHYVRGAHGWHERLVGLDPDGALAFGLAPEPDRSLIVAAPPGAVLEVGLAARAAVADLARRLKAQGGAALIIDYGYATPRFGETLQAVRDHAFVDPLDEPGEADLTAHVDFHAIRQAAEQAGARAHGPVTQGDFLRRLGIETRAAALARRNPAQAAVIAAALNRLSGPEPGMGALFKVLAITAHDGAPPPGFATSA